MPRTQRVVRADGSIARGKPTVGDMRWDGRAWRRWSGRRWVRAAYSLRPDRLLQPSKLHDGPAIDAEARRRALMLAVDDQVADNRASVVLDGPLGVVLGYRRPVAHAFHAVMTLLTGGLWILVWAAAVSRRQRRIRLDVDAWGNVWAHPLASA
jgi:hypothetical protein